MIQDDAEGDLGNLDSVDSSFLQNQRLVLFRTLNERMFQEDDDLGSSDLKCQQSQNQPPSPVPAQTKMIKEEEDDDSREKQRVLALIARLNQEDETDLADSTDPITYCQNKLPARKIISRLIQEDADLAESTGAAVTHHENQPPARASKSRMNADAGCDLGSGDSSYHQNQRPVPVRSFLTRMFQEDNLGSGDLKYRQNQTQCSVRARANQQEDDADALFHEKQRLDRTVLAILTQEDEADLAESTDSITYCQNQLPAQKIISRLIQEKADLADSTGSLMYHEHQPLARTLKSRMVQDNAEDDLGSGDSSYRQNRTPARTVKTRMFQEEDEAYLDGSTDSITYCQNQRPARKLISRMTQEADLADSTGSATHHENQLPARSLKARMIPEYEEEDDDEEEDGADLADSTDSILCRHYQPPFRALNSRMLQDEADLAGSTDSTLFRHCQPPVRTLSSRMIRDEADLADSDSIKYCQNQRPARKLISRMIQEEEDEDDLAYSTGSIMYHQSQQRPARTLKARMAQEEQDEADLAASIMYRHRQNQRQRPVRTLKTQIIHQKSDSVHRQTQRPFKRLNKTETTRTTTASLTVQLQRCSAMNKLRSKHAPIANAGFPFKRTGFVPNGIIQKRLTSAKNVQVKDFNNKIRYLEGVVQDMKNENRTLKTVQYRQDVALKKYVGTEADLPKMIQRYTSDAHYLTSSLRKSYGSCRDYEDKLRAMNQKVMKLEHQNCRLQHLVHEHDLDERHSLAAQLRAVTHHADAVETRLMEYERHIEVLEKNHFHQVEVEHGKLRNSNRKIFDARKEIERMNELVRQKDRIINYLRMRCGRELDFEPPMVKKMYSQVDEALGWTYRIVQNPEETEIDRGGEIQCNNNIITNTFPPQLYQRQIHQQQQQDHDNYSNSYVSIDESTFNTPRKSLYLDALDSSCNVSSFSETSSRRKLQSQQMNSRPSPTLNNQDQNSLKSSPRSKMTVLENTTCKKTSSI